MKSHTPHYPLPSILGALLLLTYLYFSTQPDLITFYRIPSMVFQVHIQHAAMFVLFVVILLDIRKFNHRIKKYEYGMKKLNSQINELLIAKKQLQHKAHTFSGHADKLKLFISDRLLEYIEYDEKFLHFKNIASEVRHNGVICFDKVQTALKHAIDHTTISDVQPYQEAITSMVYLWDLLELSTTDNLALHISNQLCECEEHYYQALLKDEGLSDGLSSPTFSAQSAVIRALNPFLDKPLNTHTTAIESDDFLITGDKNFWLEIEETKLLLGNENHIVLLLENLINNAMFYASKKAYTHKDARIAIRLLKHQENIRYSVYNHGPHINDEDKDQIFQLGYSTRRVREHHGKGLGLYFVNEIIKGYEGNISFQNISNSEDIYSIRIAFADGTVVTDVIETHLHNNKIECKHASDDTLSGSIEWTSKKRVLSIEVSTQTARETFSFSTANDKNIRYLDPEEPSIPRWAIEVAQRKRSNVVTFFPLDINGVCFLVDLPSAESRLDYSESIDDNNDTGEQDLLLLREIFVDSDSFIEQVPRTNNTYS